MNTNVEYVYEFKRVSWVIVFISYLPFFGIGALATYGMLKSFYFNEFSDWLAIIIAAFGLSYVFYRFLHILSTANKVGLFQEKMEVAGLLFHTQIEYNDVFEIKGSRLRPHSINFFYNKGTKKKSVNIAMEYDKHAKDQMDYVHKFLEILYAKTESYAQIDRDDIEKMLNKTH